MSRRSSPAMPSSGSARRAVVHGAIGLFATVGSVVASPVAQAVPPTSDLETLQASTGLVLVSFDQANACPVDPWSSAVAEKLTSVGGTATAVLRNTETVPVVIGDKAFRTRGMNVAYRNGQRVDVMCGCPDADDLIQWVDALQAGQDWAQVLRGSIDDSTQLQVGAHLEVSQRAMCAGDTMGAFGEIAMLWSVMPERMPEERVLRFNRVGRDMAVLARADTQVAARIEGMRDALEGSLDDIDALEEWIALNRVLLQDDATIAWYDKVKDDKAALPLVTHAAPSLFGMLVAEHRWADAGHLIGDALDWLDARKELAGGLVLALDDHAALSAAERYGDAKRVAKGILKSLPEDPSTACRLLDRAVEAHKHAPAATHKSQAHLVAKCDNDVTIQLWERTL